MFNSKKKFIPALGRRFRFDEKPILSLNKLQSSTAKQVKEKIIDGTYVFEKVICVFCKSGEFESLSEKDRYGLYHPVRVCRSCGLIQANPRMTQSNYSDFYNQEYRKLYVGVDCPDDIFFREYNKGKEIYRYITAVTGAEIKGRFIVEIGTGAGGALQYFKEKGNDVYGIDIGSEYINFGKAKNLNIEEGSIDKLGGLERSPDIVIYADVVEHLLDPIDEFRKLRNFLDVKSLVYVGTPGIKNLANAYSRDFLKLLQNAHVYYFTLTTLNNCLMKAMFGLVAGNEKIQAIYKITSRESDSINDYKPTTNFLKRIERTRPFYCLFSYINAVLQKSGIG